MDVKTVLFMITLVCELFLGGSLVLTIVIPGFRDSGFGLHPVEIRGNTNTPGA